MFFENEYDFTLYHQRIKTFQNTEDVARSKFLSGEAVEIR